MRFLSSTMYCIEVSEVWLIPLKWQNFKERNHQFWHQIWVDREKVLYKKWVSSKILKPTHFLHLQMRFWGTSRRNFKKRKTLPYCTFSRSTQIWCQNWWFLTIKFFYFIGISQTSLTSMGSIVDAGNLKFWENYPKVVLKRNIITVNCVVIVGPPYSPLLSCSKVYRQAFLGISLQKIHWF